jgi:hypothetical protein
MLEENNFLEWNGSSYIVEDTKQNTTPEKNMTRARPSPFTAVR